MGTTPNKGFPFPEDTDPLSQGDDAIKNLATAVDTAMMVILPVSLGGSGANNRSLARQNFGIYAGLGEPGGVPGDGDVYFKIV